MSCICETDTYTYKAFKLFFRSENDISGVGEVELTQLGTFTGELGKSTIDDISNVSLRFGSHR